VNPSILTRNGFAGVFARLDAKLGFDPDPIVRQLFPSQSV
jgi:hypothetical protein